MIIKIDTGNAQRQLIKGFSELSQKKINLSITRSINSALGKTQTAAIRAVTSRYNLTHSDVADRFHIVQASPATTATMMRGYLKAYNNTFPLSYFKAREIKGGTVTTIDRRKKTTISERKAKFLRKDKTKVIHGVVVEVLRGKAMVIPSAFIRNTGVLARGQYSRGFQFNIEDKNRTLRSISVPAVLRTNEINPILKEYAENEYLRILYKELQKRVKGVGEQHSKHV